MPFAPTWMDLRDSHTKSDKEKQLLFIISMCNLENSTNQLIYKTNSQTWGKGETHGYQRGKGARRLSEECRITDR